MSRALYKIKVGELYHVSCDTFMTWDSKSGDSLEDIHRGDVFYIADTEYESFKEAERNFSFTILTKHGLRLSYIFWIRPYNCEIVSQT